MNDSNIPPTPPTNTSESTQAPPFPQRAAKICLLIPGLIFVLVWVLGTLKAQIPFLTTPAGVLVSTGIYFLMLLAGLGFGVVALLGIPRYGRKYILGRAVFGMIASGLLLLIMVTNFVSARSKAQMQTAKMAEAQEAVRDLSRDAQADDSPHARSNRLEKMRSHVENAAEGSTGPEGVIMRANALFLKQMQESSRHFEDVAEQFDPDEVLNLASSQTKEGLAAKQTAVQDYIDANASLRDFLAGAEDLFRNAFVKAKLAPKDIETAMAALRKGFGDKVPMLLRVRDSVDGYAKAHLAVVNLLDANHGKWSYDEAADEFKADESLQAEYLDLLRKIDLAAAEQNAAEEERQKVLAQ